MGPITWLDRLGAGQHGLVTREQLHAAGVSEPTVGRWLVAGRVVGVFSSVYRVAGAPVTWEQRVLAAVLGAGQGAVASHRSAARLWGLLDDDTVEVSVPRPRRPRSTASCCTGPATSAPPGRCPAGAFRRPRPCERWSTWGPSCRPARWRTPLIGRWRRGC